MNHLCITRGNHQCITRGETNMSNSSCNQWQVLLAMHMSHTHTRTIHVKAYAWSRTAPLAPPYQAVLASYAAHVAVRASLQLHGTGNVMRSDTYKRMASCRAACSSLPSRACIMRRTRCDTSCIQMACCRIWFMQR